MPTMTIEQRLAELERRVAALEHEIANGVRPKDWHSVMGMFSGDEVMRQIRDEALKFRERDREKARRRYAPRKKEKKS